MNKSLSPVMQKIVTLLNDGWRIEYYARLLLGKERDAHAYLIRTSHRDRKLSVASFNALLKRGVIEVETVGGSGNRIHRIYRLTADELETLPLATTIESSDAPETQTYAALLTERDQLAARVAELETAIRGVLMYVHHADGRCAWCGVSFGEYHLKTCAWLVATKQVSLMPIDTTEDK